MTITITRHNDLLAVSAPYDKAFIHNVKKIGGRWNPENKTWEIKDRHEKQLRVLAIEHFGTDGSSFEGQRTVTLRIKVSEYADYSEIRLAGHTIARRRSRDTRPVLGEDVAILEGDFPARGGSVANPRLLGEDVILAWYDVPESVAAAAMQADGVNIMPENEASATQRRKELEAEREELKARLAFIEQELKALGA
ncbi:hypothetical protein [Corynebacterium ulcerans]|uniref:hypothetical protein n=1 Tax=Corynebacterium ulcerans TaxID=65058 RepID=UPI0018D5CBB4|nr:hypothetical protein [Corynebacterium ulcerans]MBH5296181.1 hypothetical protein [Corynebacterium ulcerans]